ncbi:MAG: LLM class flavin-dependent oxidoreductase, partial [Chloroflexi bacterium]|nr:LLM class flavin-dependent oxidoreductase [Chloroflexota bacterium]
MKFGFCPRLPDDGDGTARLIQQAQLAQESGFDSAWLSDDALSPASDSAALVAAAAVAACTSSLRIGVRLPLGLSHP